MNPTIQTFLRALQTPDTSLKSLTAARAATDAAGLPRLQRSTRFRTKSRNDNNKQKKR